jgi:outer membrane protein assembly factor BamB
LARPWVALLLAVTLTSANRAEDWPQFRGPTGQGVYPGRLPTDWGPGRNVAWKQAIPGKGWSSPVLCGGRVYLSTAVPVAGTAAGDQSLQALCLDASTGKLLWQREVFRQNAATAPPVHAKNSHASPTPVTDGRRLYVHFGHQGTACLDLDGKVLWRNTSLGYVPQHGNGGSPILADGALVFSCDGTDRQFVVALDAGTGRVRWKTNRSVDFYKKFSFSTPLVVPVAGRQLVVSPGSGAVCAYDLRSGEEIWRVRYDGYSVVCRPAYGAGLVLVSTGYDSPRLLAIRPDGRGDVTDTHVAWSIRQGTPQNPSPLIVGHELYLVSDQGLSSCLDARTGRAYWQRRVGGAYSASPLYADGKLYLQDEEGTGVVLKAGREFAVLARNALSERSLASCAATDGALYIRTEQHLYRIADRSIP